MAQNILRYNVVIVGKFFNKGSWMSEAWRKAHPEEFMEEPDGPPRRILNGEERMELLRLEPNPTGAMCVRSPGTPPPHGVRLTPAGGETPKLLKERTYQPT